MDFTDLIKTKAIGKRGAFSFHCVKDRHSLDGDVSFRSGHANTIPELVLRLCVKTDSPIDSSNGIFKFCKNLMYLGHADSSVRPHRLHGRPRLRTSRPGHP